MAVSPTASAIPPVVVVITGPPPASIFSTNAIPKVSTNSGRGLLGSTKAAQPAIKCGFSSSSTSSRKLIRFAAGVCAANSRSCCASGPLPAITSCSSLHAGLAVKPVIKSSTPLARASLDRNST
jgi:hypothetical protein